MRTEFDRQLGALNHWLIQMGAICEKVISQAASSIARGDKAPAAEIPPLAEKLRGMARDAEGLCMRLFLQQQPVAGDLRHISAALKMVTDMQRIGDQAEDMAEIIAVMKTDGSYDFREIDRMAEAAIKMVTGSVDAFVHQNTALAEQVIRRDDEVDSCFLRVRSSLIELIRKNPQDGEEALDLFMIAKYFERMADHAVNIAGWVRFSVTGELQGGSL